MSLIIKKTENKLNELAEKIISELDFKHSENAIKSLTLKIERVKLFTEIYSSKVDIVIDEILEENSILDNNEIRKQLFDIANSISIKYSRDLIS